MSRAPLPKRRSLDTFELVHRGQIYFVGIGHYDDGEIGEVFVQAKCTSSETEWLARDSAILISLAIQHGCPLETMRHTVTREENGSPSTLAGAILDILTADSERLAA